MPDFLAFRSQKNLILWRAMRTQMTPNRTQRFSWLRDGVLVRPWNAMAYRNSFPIQGITYEGIQVLMLL